MSYRKLEPLSRQVTIIIGLGVVSFMAFGLAVSFYRNTLFEQTLNNIEDQNDQLLGDIEQGYRDLEYFTSTQYKDKYAKENLNLINQGEKTLLIAKENLEVEIGMLDRNGILDEQREAKYFELLRQMPIIEHWKLYLFYKEKIEGLKQSL
ncbi:hypothetical protein HN512_03620 [Candidatus Peregrinibacteria bacterium]|nr:hypothetical protein [Candidatus Peregrinibacteria bacterium]MBT3598902.1 hypothetical protein [Candidatus Peregrinibacteria bacterium]MBT4367315.1 hypothetical protein [Candidatus Peregrinibacteria bacterium]MBT4585790.1 hypothetical protein [Candidatus Peregrinibacteria bacterium]MBT6730701.1 hypothetical protein [Candidatus Peregrinibacteria bacterium]